MCKHFRMASTKYTLRVRLKTFVFQQWGNSKHRVEVHAVGPSHCRLGTARLICLFILTKLNSYLQGK